MRRAPQAACGCASAAAECFFAPGFIAAECIAAAGDNSIAADCTAATAFIGTVAGAAAAVVLPLMIRQPVVALRLLLSDCFLLT